MASLESALALHYVWMHEVMNDEQYNIYPFDPATIISISFETPSALQ